MKTVLVFKTSVTQEAEIKRLSPVLDCLIDHQDKWNFDLEDCDKILRIESNSVSGRAIETSVQAEGFYCEELKD